jgi:hypothetical protein
MLDLTGHMIIWGGLFAHGDESTGLMKVVFCYVLPTVVQRFGGNETLHFRTTSCLTTPQAMELSQQPLAVKNVVQFGLYVA